MWIDGFKRAMRLRPDTWEKIALSGDEDAAASVCTILTLPGTHLTDLQRP